MRVALIVMLLVSSACMSRRSSTSAEASQGHVPAEGGERVVCRRESVVGSHTKQRVCRTVGESRRERDKSQENLRGMTPTAPSSGEGMR
jgi:hypothetical protein